MTAISGHIKGSVTPQEAEYGSISILSTDLNSYVLTPKLHTSENVVFNQRPVYSADGAADETSRLRVDEGKLDGSPMNLSHCSDTESLGLMSEHRV